MSDEVQEPTDADGLPDDVSDPPADAADSTDSVADERSGFFDRVTGLWSNDPRYNEPGGSAGDVCK